MGLPQVVARHLHLCVCSVVPVEGNRTLQPVPGTPSPGLLGFQVNEQIRTSLSLGSPINKMRALDSSDTCLL